MAYATATADMAILETDATIRAQGGTAADGLINQAFAEGGYSVPVDASELVSPLGAQLEADLAFCSRALWRELLTNHLSDASDKIKADADRWREWLKKIANGTLTFPGLTRDDAANQPAFAIAGETENDFSPELFDALRGLTGEAM